MRSRYGDALEFIGPERFVFFESSKAWELVANFDDAVSESELSVRV